MLKVGFFTFGPFQENTYILSNQQKQCWLIDPGMYDKEETKKFIEYIDSNQLIPQAIINTHAHIDHIFGVQALIDKYNIPFAIHPKDKMMLENAVLYASMFGVALSASPKPTFYINGNENYMAGEDILEIRFTPGHSPGSVVFYYPEGGWLIGGDVLFAGSIGRTDLPGGDFDTLITSIRQELFTLPPETIVYPGHGPATTIAAEMQNNPFLQ
jgi:glyoxylase-like metal-dependent hydrolase (beta-lactamase superfamily II)